MRLLISVLVVLIIAAGMAFGALNAESATLNLLLLELSLPLGVWVLSAVVLGVAAGGFAVYLLALMPARRQLRRLQRSLALRESAKDSALTHE